MRHVWVFARRLANYPGRLTLALLLAFCSAASLGVGLVGLIPVLRLILGGSDRHRQDLHDLARAANDSLAAKGWGVAIPQNIIDALPAGPYNAALALVGALGLLTVLGAAANFGHVYTSLTLVNRVINRVRQDVFRHMLRRPLRQIVALGPVDAVARVINDTAMLAGGLTALLSKALAESTKALAALAAAFAADWRLAGVAVLAAPPVGWLIKRLGRRIRRSSRTALEHQASLARVSLEAMQGLRVIKSSTAEHALAGRFRARNEAMLRELNRVRTARALASPLIEVVAIFVVGGLALVAIKAVLDGQLDPTRMLAALAALGMAGSAIKPLTGILSDVQASAGAAKRLTELLALPPEPGLDRALPRLPRHSASIVLRDVWLTYPGASEPALRGVSLEVPHGSRVAIVGGNGSGKTTLLTLVPRLMDPDKGAVLIDGRDIREVWTRSLRRQIGVVTQETVLIKDTVLANIALGVRGASKEKIIAAARAARAHEFIERLPQGYETVLAEQGASLSGGQRQRLAIARAVLRDPAILILDEATSMIDARSEALISEALDDFSQGRTTLIVAHRLSTVLRCDEIVVLDHGQLVDRGTHERLLSRCAVYQDLARHQLVSAGAEN